MHYPKLLVAAATWLAFSVVPALAVDVTISSNPASYGTFMNVFDLGAGGTQGGYVFGTGWSVPDLKATITGSTLTMQPNSSAYETSPDVTFWRSNGGAGPLGNKFMDAAIFISGNSLIGQDVNFSFIVDSNTFTSSHSATAFIRMFNADFSSVISEVTQPVTSTGLVSLMATAAQTGAIGVANIQYGFNIRGINSSEANLPSYGAVSVTAVPEPSQAILLVVAGAIAFFVYRRRKA